MATKVKNKEWVEFKKKFIAMYEILSIEFDGFDISEDDDNFDIVVQHESVPPIFIKNHNELKVQYDFTLCDTKVRLLTFSIYKDAGRIEFLLKSGENINHSM